MGKFEPLLELDLDKIGLVYVPENRKYRVLQFSEVGVESNVIAEITKHALISIAIANSEPLNVTGWPKGYRKIDEELKKGASNAT